MLISHAREELIHELLCTWLRLREVFLARVTIPGLDKPIGAKAWKTLFGNQLSGKSSHMNAFQQQAADILNVISAQFNGESLDPEKLRSCPMKWQDEDITADGVLAKGREIVWELTELGFRADFLAIDEFMNVEPEVTSQTSALSYAWWRDLRLSRINRSNCWPDLPGHVDFGHINESLATTDFWTRYDVLGAFHRAMNTWLEHASFLILPFPDWFNSRPITADMEKTLDDIEYEMAKYYLVAFKCVFGRAAIIPHKL
jgi:hypothetical protein